MCFTWFLCQFVFNKRFLKIYCLSVCSFFLVSFTSMYTTLKIISRKFLGVRLIWTFFTHVGAIFYETAHIDCIYTLDMSMLTITSPMCSFISTKSITFVYVYLGQIKKCVVPVTLPTLIFNPYPKDFFAILQ